ncbi:MAG: glycosyltransferase [Anaerolineales bacterium]|nr:glycosyltransferase [Anaerolineales bacterium]
MPDDALGGAAGLPRLALVLPCYNEADNLPRLLEAYAAAHAATGLPHDLVLVNNGSTDASAAVLARELARPELAFARAVTVPVNQGFGHGTFAGLQAAAQAGAQIVGFSHADLQYTPHDCLAAYQRLLAEPDPARVLVKGKRAPRGLSAGLVTNTMAALASLVLLMPLTDINAQPKLFHRSHLARLVRPPPGFQFDLYVLYAARRAGLRLLTVPVTFGPRAYGQSKWAFSFLSRSRTIWATIVYIFQLRFGRA